MGKSAKMSIMAFARKVGYKTSNSITTGIKKGYLDGYLIQENGKTYIINPDEAHEYWLTKVNVGKKDKIKLSSEDEGKKPEINEDNLHLFDSEDVSKLERYYKAKKAEFEFKRIQGDLIHKDEIKKVFGGILNEVRVEIEGLPLLITDEIRAAKDRSEAIRLFKRKINEILTKLSK